MSFVYLKKLRVFLCACVLYFFVHVFCVSVCVFVVRLWACLCTNVRPDMPKLLPPVRPRSHHRLGRIARVTIVRW